MGSIHNTRILRFLIVLCTVILTIFIYASYSSNTSLQPHMRSPGAGGGGGGGSPSVMMPMQAAAYSQVQSQQQQKHQQKRIYSINGTNKTEEILTLSGSSGGERTVARGGLSINRLHINTNSTGTSGTSGTSGTGVSGTGIASEVNVLSHKKVKSNSNVIPKKPHHRQPTIDVDAGGGGGGGGVGGDGGGGVLTVSLATGPGSVDDLDNDIAAGDDIALERLSNNDLMEEQFVQNVDTQLGNLNNSLALISPQSQQEQQNQLSQKSQKQQQQKDRQQQQKQLGDNNTNKILDSDVLIPTSNLQKFMESADKMLKNLTTVATAGSGTGSASGPTANDRQQQNVQAAMAAINRKDDNGDIDDDDGNEDEALPPSVIMTIKRNHASGGAAEAAAPAAGAETRSLTQALLSAAGAVKINPRAAKVTPKPNLNATITNSTVDPAKGIQTQQIYESGHMNDELNINKICPFDGADLKLLILITSAQSHAFARLAIRQTWGHYGTRRDVSTAFILGRTTNESLNLALTQENFIYGDLIRGHFIDSYNNLTLKTVSALEWVDKHCSKAKYVLKTDDDMFINVPKLLAFLEGHSKEKRVIYGRLAKKWKPIRNKKSKYYVSTDQFAAPVFPHFTTGPAYVMSSDIVHELYVSSLNQVYLKLEDVFTTGVVAQQLGIKRVHVNEFLNRRIAFNPCNIRKAISVHMIKANEQFDLWKKLLDQTTKCK